MSQPDFAQRRTWMVQQHIAERGIRDPLILEALSAVPREIFLPENLGEFAYEDAPLPIAEGQTVSQPYIVALMMAALDLKGGEKILEVGTGSGYAAAVLAQIAKDVYTIEQFGQLAEKAAAVLAEHDYRNVHVLHGDGRRGWPDHAPFDAILVATGNPGVPNALKRQLKIGGHLIIPTGIDRRVQELVRVTRVTETDYKSEDIADIRFMPKIGGEEQWSFDKIRSTPPRERAGAQAAESNLIKALGVAAERFDDIDQAGIGPLLERIGDARVVLLGGATHGTSEFYRMRDRITRVLVTHKGFNFIAVEGDWPDAARIDREVRHAHAPSAEWAAFARFPTWMWQNREVKAFVDWLRVHNQALDPARRVAFYGLDLYSGFRSVQAVLDYLERVDPPTAASARERYGCLTPWQSDPATFANAALTGHYQSCEIEVVGMLKDLLGKESAYVQHDGEQFLDALQNARLIADAEHFYRTMYYGSRLSWNLRDRHMFDTLQTLLAFHGPQSKAVIWAHNAHVGDSSATEMSLRGELNLGHLCKQAFGTSCYAIGFGTAGGTVAAASMWDGPTEIKAVRPALPQSYENLFHRVDGPNFLLPLRFARGASSLPGLDRPRLERAIGVIYRPDTELQSHYFQAELPQQFDELVWFDWTSAVTPLPTAAVGGVPGAYPFGL